MAGAHLCCVCVCVCVPIHVWAHLTVYCSTQHCCQLWSAHTHTHTHILLHFRIGSSTYWSSLHLLAKPSLRWERRNCVWMADTAGPGQTRLNMERWREILHQSLSIIRPSFPPCLSLSLRFLISFPLIFQSHTSNCCDATVNLLHTLLSLMK